MKMLKKIIEKVEKREEVLTGAFARLDDLHALIMELHYIHGLPWEKVAENTHYSLRMVYHIRIQCINKMTDAEIEWL